MKSNTNPWLAAAILAVIAAPAAVKDGQFQHLALKANGLNAEDIEEAARLSHGLVEMDDILQATLEKDGQISIVPRRHQPS